MGSTKYVLASSWEKKKKQKKRLSLTSFRLKCVASLPCRSLYFIIFSTKSNYILDNFFLGFACVGVSTVPLENWHGMHMGF